MNQYLQKNVGPKSNRGQYDPTPYSLPIFCDF